VNLSFKDKKLNNQLDYFSILINTPQDIILEQFNRVKNSYCKSTNKHKFSLPLKTNRITMPNTIDFWLDKLMYQSATITSIKPTFWLANGKKEQYKKETIFFDEQNKAFSLIKNSFLKELKNNSKKIAIVEKTNISNVRYFEFRMIGNTNYQSRFSEIKKNINTFRQILRKSIQPLIFSN
jgi:hypothetical protein